ncbi:hypothetical protein MPLA_320187 [Mesorhizobium sp. ORS 3359]|nr:hypothetical protein MPLA_320187 [Mesorhizobium sp. ORS 3359]
MGRQGGEQAVLHQGIPGFFQDRGRAFAADGADQGSPGCDDACRYQRGRQLIAHQPIVRRKAADPFSLKRVAILQIRSSRFSSFILRMSLLENRFPLSGHML